MSALRNLWLLGIALNTTQGATEWPCFRGPDGSGIAAADAKPPTTWSDSQNLKWKLTLPGPGSSSPIVSGERIFITCYSGYGDGSNGGSPDKLQRHLICVDRKAGKILWDKSVPADLPEDPYFGPLTEHGYASSTPATDGERVYVFFGKTGALAFDHDGKQLWKVNLGKQSGSRHWGSGASPILCKNIVIINASEESRSIYALDKLTGKEVWKAEADSTEFCYGTPALVESAGSAELVIAVPGEMWGLNLDNGKVRWFAKTGIEHDVSASVTAADGVAYATGGFPRQGTIAVRAGGKDDVTESHVIWKSQNASSVPTPAVHDGYLFVVTDQGFAVCMEVKTGKLVFKERLPGASGTGRSSKPFYASCVLANGNIYAVSRRNGTFVFEAKPEFKLVAQNKLAGDTSDFNGTPAVVGNQLFLRSNRSLYCIGYDAGG
jgi:outer membrane protein assembly factor BamB